MADPEGIELSTEPPRRTTAYPRAVGSPLPRGGVCRPNYAESGQESGTLTPPPPGRALPSGEPSEAGAEFGSGVQRAVNAIRMAIPLVQRILPLLDGNIITTVAHAFRQNTHKPEPPVNLAPIHDSVTELQIQHRELHEQVIEQRESIKKVEDQLTLVREATDRNTLEQQELMEDLKVAGTKMNVIAVIALLLLAVSLLLNLVLYLHIQRVLP